MKANILVVDDDSKIIKVIKKRRTLTLEEAEKIFLKNLRNKSVFRQQCRV